MTIRVLIVDDSKFICKRIREILEEDHEFLVVGVAFNGLEAVQLAASVNPDVITMDVNMPVMDGIAAVKQIMSTHPCPILMFSAMTQIGAKETLDALQAGAIDFLPKQLKEIDADQEIAKNLLRLRLRMVARQANQLRIPTQQVKNVLITADSPSSRISSSVKKKDRPLDLLVIAASTGGPVAIQQILRQISTQFMVPVLLLQHMPKEFTKSFAERLNQLCQLHVKEAKHGDVLQPGTALLGPGGMQIEIELVAGQYQVVISAKRPHELYSPCIDVTFTSLANQFKGQILVVVLTGMGADGKEGAIKLKQQGAKIWAQDESSSTIYGMPRAIAEANIADKIYSLDEIANAFKTLS